MKRLISIAFLLALLLCGCSSMDLYEYALTMEDDNSFACTDGYIYKSYNRYTETNNDGSISVAKSSQITGWNTGASTKKKRAEDMEPHEFIFATGQTAYIRNDGSIWLGVNDKAYLFSPHDNTVPEQPEHTLSLSISHSHRSIDVTLTNNGETTLTNPCVFLLVQLADGNWYDYGSMYNVHWGMKYSADYSSRSPIQPIVSRINESMERGAVYEYNFQFPKNGNKYISGKYRVAVCSGLSSEGYPTDNDPTRGILLYDADQLEAYVEFELSNAAFNTFELSNFESTIDDLTVK